MERVRRSIAAAIVVVSLAGIPAGASTVALRFRQDQTCAAVQRWDVLAAPIVAGSPAPTIQDAQVVASLARSDVAGSCGSSELTATVDVGGLDGDLRWWLVAVAASGASAASGSRDVTIPPPPVGLETTTVGGGGSVAKDCVVVLVAPANHPPPRPREVWCVDGDPSCDADATVNGECEVPVSVCANATYRSDRCVSPGVQSISIKRADEPDDRRFDPAFPELQDAIARVIAPPSTAPDVCTPPVAMHVAVHWNRAGDQCSVGRNVLEVESLAVASDAGQVRDADRLIVTCWPPASGCPPPPPAPAP